MASMLEVRDLQKFFGEAEVVKKLNFEARIGEVVGFLGPNGAGKSTTMKMITGHLPPSSGEAFIAGLPISTSSIEAQKKIGYVPENAPLYDELFVREFLAFVCDLREISHDRIDPMISKCALEEVEFQKIETLSKGYRRRVSLAQALIHDPDLLILDEPTDGLDPNQKHDVRELIKALKQNKCILVSTHILEEVEEICDRCLIIGKGEILYEGDPADLKSKSASGRIQDVFRALTTGDAVEGVSLC